MRVGSFIWLALHIFATQSVLLSSNKSETAVHGCDPALSALVMLVSRNRVFHVVSALQSFAFIHFILADQTSCRSYVGSVYRMRSLAVSYSLVLGL